MVSSATTLKMMEEAELNDKKKCVPRTDIVRQHLAHPHVQPWASVHSKEGRPLAGEVNSREWRLCSFKDKDALEDDQRSGH